MAGPDVGLKKGALGIVGAATMGAVMMSPALALYGNFGPMAKSAGNTTPLIFLLSLLVTLPTAICYAVISREIPSSGSAYTWLWEAVSPPVGVWTGWMLGGFFLIVVFLQPLLFGIFFNDLARFCGFPSGYETFAISVAVSSIITSLLTYRGVQISEKSSLIDIIIQALIVAALGVTIVVVLAFAGDGFSEKLDFKPFLPSSSPTGFSGISAAMIFGVLCFVGFGVISSMAEETRNPRKSIPRAIVLACVIVGLFWVVVAWAYATAIPTDKILDSMEKDVNPVVPIAQKFWGVGEILVILTGLIAALGVYIATVVGASRTLYAMGRDGSIPSLFGRLNNRHQVPWNALHLTFFLTFLFVLIPAYFAGITRTYEWWGRAVVFFAVVTYILVSIANPVFYLKYRRESFSIIWNGLAAVISLAVNAYLLYRAFFVECWKEDWYTGKSVVAFSVGWMVLGVVYTLFMKRRSPELFTRKAQRLRED